MKGVEGFSKNTNKHIQSFIHYLRHDVHNSQDNQLIVKENRLTD